MNITVKSAAMNLKSWSAFLTRKTPGQPAPIANRKIHANDCQPLLLSVQALPKAEPVAPAQAPSAEGGNPHQTGGLERQKHAKNRKPSGKITGHAPPGTG